jgi:hypothetical protein
MLWSSNSKKLMKFLKKSRCRYEARHWPQKIFWTFYGKQTTKRSFDIISWALKHGTPNKHRLAAETQWNRTISETCHSRWSHVTVGSVIDRNKRSRSVNLRRAMWCCVYGGTERNRPIWATSIWSDDWFWSLLWATREITPGNWKKMTRIE